MAELVDAPDSKSGGEIRESSILSLGTIIWRSGRVVYGSGLENRRGRNATVSSNLTFSAILSGL